MPNEDRRALKARGEDLMDSARDFAILAMLAVKKLRSKYTKEPMRAAGDAEYLAACAAYGSIRSDIGMLLAGAPEYLGDQASDMARKLIESALDEPNGIYRGKGGEITEMIADALKRGDGAMIATVTAGLAGCPADLATKVAADLRILAAEAFKKAFAAEMIPEGSVWIVTSMTSIYDGDEANPEITRNAAAYASKASAKRHFDAQCEAVKANRSRMPGSGDNGRLISESEDAVEFRLTDGISKSNRVEYRVGMFRQPLLR